MLPFTEFPTDIKHIRQRVYAVDPLAYVSSRNYVHGAVTRLSPYISRGVISTRHVLSSLVERGFSFQRMEKLVQELAWRDYWQSVWVQQGDGIDNDLHYTREPSIKGAIPHAMVQADTGIQAIDEAIRMLYSTGYIHNHVRMYIAMLACSIGRCHWSLPAKWMYYYLLDADWASNALSWQWVAGNYIARKYVANQDNINRYSGTTQKDTFLDREYEELLSGETPSELKELVAPAFVTDLPRTEVKRPVQGKPACVYTIYNLDPEWRKDADVTRVLLLEPSFFRRYPMSERSLGFILALTKNIPGICIYTGEFSEWMAAYRPSQVYYKEHPTVRHFKGIEDSRDWAFRTDKHYRSFSGFWNEVRRSIVFP